MIRGALRLAVLVGSLVLMAAAARPALAGTLATVDVIPRPSTATHTPGTFPLTRLTRIVVARRSSAATPVATELAADLRPATGFPLRVVAGTARRGDISLSLSGPAPADGSTASEAYRLKVTPHGVHLQAPRPHGLFDAVQTLRQLLPAAVAADRRQGGRWTIPAVRIADRPRYTYRGFMVDMARHYQSPAVIKRLIDEISAYKINVLHLHVSDDEAFRITINGFPRLTTIGAQGAVGTGGRPMDPGGFWTQAQYRSVVADAAAHFITVIPEVDSPGHANATIMSEYADTANPLLDGHPQTIDCSTEKPPAWNYTGDVANTALCPESPDTWAILTAIIHQLTALSPGPYYDIGGGDVPPTLLSASGYAAFINRESALVASTGKTVMGWADIAGPGTAPPAGSVAEYFQAGSGADPLTVTATEAAAKQLKLVMAPSNHAYLDQKYVVSHDSVIPADLGLSFECPTGCDVSAFYNWDPAQLITGVTDRQVLGVEAPLFTETTPTFADVQYMTFPRLLAVAEIGWSPGQRRTATSRAYRDFLSRLAGQGPRLMYAGVNFYPSSQVPWRLTVTPAAHIPAHGRVVNGALAVAAAPGLPAGLVRARIAWGDGSTSPARVHGSSGGQDQINGVYRLVARHTYRTEGHHTVTVTVNVPHRPPTTVKFAP